MAKDTRNKICAAATELFSDIQFETVSIAEICRKAEVSNGVYYRYFKNKEELQRSLIDNFLIQFENGLNSIKGESIEEKLLSFISVILEIAKSHRQEISIFREGQYRLNGYEDKLRDLYIKSAESVFERSIVEAEYLYIISGLRFCSTRALYNNMDVDPKIIGDFILHGVFNEITGETVQYDIPEDFSPASENEADTSYLKLIHSGIKLFGQSGFHNIGIAEITRISDLAVGTFYSHFKSKEQFLNTIVNYIGEKTRHYLSDKLQDHENRMDQEVWGIWYFLSYFHKHPEYYSIVREAEFVGRDVVSQYYDSFEKGYMKNLKNIPMNKRNHASNFLIGLSHYTGIEILLRNRISDTSEFINRMAILLKNGISE